jgi:hypothetical protein
VTNRFGLRTCDFYALRAVGIQDIFVRCIGDQTRQSGSKTDQYATTGHAYDDGTTSKFYPHRAELAKRVLSVLNDLN